MPTLSASQKNIFYRAYVSNDSRYEGIFFLAVKTTGVFCRPGCKAKTPKPQNVEFYSTAQQALAHGYRACKKCRPLQHSGDAPDWVRQALDLVENNPHKRISDAELKSGGVDPARIRRWFKQHRGMTFQAYQRRHKIGRALDQIRQGQKVIDSAYDIGYQSLSGFHDTFRKYTGFVPSSSKQHSVACTAQMLTPLGPMLAAATENGLCLLEFTDRIHLQRQVERVQKRLQLVFVAGQHVLLKSLQTQLSEYFNRQRQLFTITLDLAGTEFQCEAWRGLQSIPYAQTRSYQQQAEALGRPQAFRAVGHANGQNPLAIVIPCHRVIAKNGKLAGYAGGLWRKQYLINLEQGN